MKRKGFLVGAIIWTVIAALLLGVLVIALTGGKLLSNLPGLERFGGGISFVSGAGTELVKEESYPLSGIDKIDISASYHNINVILTNGSEIKLRQYDSNGDNLFDAQQGGSQLTIDIPSRVIIGIMNFSNPRLDIELPESYADAVSLTTSSGGISASGSPHWGKTIIASGSGTIRFDGITGAGLDISSSSGGVRLGKVSGQDVTISSNSGTVRTGDISAKNDLSISTSSGSINSENLEAENIAVKANSGTLRLGDVSASGEARLETSSGSQNVGMLSASAFRLFANSGTMRYDGISGCGTVSSTSGSINCSGLDVRGDSLVESSSGTVRITLAGNQNFAVMISTNSGSISEGPLRLMYDKSGRNASGTAGDGSSGTLSIKTSSGSIRVN